MTADNRSATERSKDSGVSILIVAVGMIFVLGMAGLGIDLASLYVARSQAQRSADAAALAGAQALVDNQCVPGPSGGGLTSYCMSVATQNAVAVGDKNLIAGVSPNLQGGNVDVTFPNQTSSDPQIKVVAGRGTYDGLNHGNAMPTFFMKIFGITSATVTASAKAEAFNPSGTTSSIGSSCMKPWLFPNCDQFNPNVTSQSSVDCTGSVGPFINSSGQVARPENYPTGALYEPFSVKPGFTSGAAAPGQFYAAYLPANGAVPTSCPSCAGTTPTSGGTGSGALYQANIECCNTNVIYCGEDLTLDQSGQNAIDTAAGNMVGPTEHGVNCLIQQDEGSGSASCGQDYISNGSLNSAPKDACTDPSKQQGPAGLPQIDTFPPLIEAGVNNLLNTPGTQIPASASNSVIVAPIYSGIITSGQSTVQVVGIIQLFIRDYAKSQQGTVYAYVLGISGCGSGGTTVNGGSGGNGAVTSTYGTNVPVRLIN